MTNSENPAALREEIEKLREDLGALRDLMSGISQDAKRAAKVGAHEAKARVEDAAHRAKEVGKHTAENIEQKIENNPLAAIGIAFGVGILLGVLMRRN